MQSIKVTDPDPQLRILIEEFIAMQRSQFTFRELCSYILYRAMEEERTANKGLYESNQMDAEDCKRVNSILDKIVGEDRIKEEKEGNKIMFVKIKN